MIRLIRKFGFRVLVLAVLILLLVLPALALAASTGSIAVKASSAQLWTVIIGGLVPLVTYVLNHWAPWVGEAVKATVLAVAAAAAGALYTAVETNVFGWNSATLQLVISAVVAAFLAHALIWKPSTISAKLGGGSNAPKPAA